MSPGRGNFECPSTGACPLTSARSSSPSRLRSRRPRHRGRLAARSMSVCAASISECTGHCRSPDTMAASTALAPGKMRRFVAAPRGDGDGQKAASWPARRHRATGHRRRYRPADSRCGSTPDAQRMPRAIGRSNAAPTFRTSVGARLTVTRSGGNGNPQFRIAVRTRSRLSRTVASGNPTIVTPGSPGETSTSTETGTASRPSTVAAVNRASTPGAIVQSPRRIVREQIARKALGALDGRGNKCNELGRDLAHFARTHVGRGLAPRADVSLAADGRRRVRHSRRSAGCRLHVMAVVARSIEEAGRQVVFHSWKTCLMRKSPPGETRCDRASCLITCPQSASARSPPWSRRWRLGG